MLSFFGGLFGGLYYAGRILNEKAEKKLYEKRRYDYQLIDDQIKYPIGNSSEYEPPKNRDEFWIMAESISGDLKYIFGDRWRTEINYPLISNYPAICMEYESRGIFTHPLQVVYEVWLSKKGKLSILRQRRFHLAGFVYANNEETRGIVLRACEIIEKNLQEAHPELPLRLRVKDGSEHLLEWEHWTKNYNGTLGRRLW